MIGVLSIFSLFLVLLWRIVRLAILSRENFSRFFATGMALVLIIQMFINIGMNLGLMPIIGIPLPLVSYGGSNLILTFVGLGILQGIKINSV